jgi:hypothetical protein
MNRFDRDIDELVASINSVYDQIIDLSNQQRQQASQLNSLTDRIAALAAEMDVEMDLPDKQILPPVATDMIEPAVAVLSPERRQQLKRLYSSVPTFPEFNRTDYFVMASVGMLGSLADSVLTSLVTGGGLRGVGTKIPARKISQALQKRDLDPNGVTRSLFVKQRWGISPSTIPSFQFSDTYRVPSARVNDPDGLDYLTDVVNIAITHQNTANTQIKVASLAHDAISRYDISAAQIAALLSDIVNYAIDTLKLVPVGQLFQQIPNLAMSFIQSPEAREATRHVLFHAFKTGINVSDYIIMGIAPGIIELLIRTYVWLRGVDSIESLDVNYWQTEGQIIASTEKQARLQAMLFCTHGFAVALNAGKVGLASTLSGGNFFAAMSSINRTQWEVFVLHVVRVIMEATRDKKLETIMANRSRLNQKQNKILLYDMDWRSMQVMKLGEV